MREFRHEVFLLLHFNLLQKISALENVKLPLIYSPTRIDEAQKKAAELLSQVGLSQRIFHRPNQLSGGEQQRVAIARALINDPALILADEPTGNLDSQSGEQILDLLIDLNRRGKTVVVVTHDSQVAASCPTVIKMKDGEIVSSI